MLRSTGKGAETIQYQRRALLLRNVPGVRWREANFQAVGDTSEFYQDSCQPRLNTPLPRIFIARDIFSSVKAQFAEEAVSC